MEFKKYQHVERYGTTSVEGIELGTTFVFPKIDGSNCQVYYDGEVKCGSRNRELTLEKDNAGFMAYIETQDNIKKCVTENKQLRLYGEWLCLSGDTKIKLVSNGKRGHAMTLREMFAYSITPVKEKNYYKTKKENKEYFTIRPPWWERYGYPQCFSFFTNEDKIKPQKISKIISTGDKDVFEIKTRKGYTIKSTLEHKFLTNYGWKKLKDIKVGDVVAVSELFNHRQKRIYGNGSRKIIGLFKKIRDNNHCNICGAKTSLEIHHKDENWENNNIDNLVVLCRDCHSKIHKNITAVNKEFDYEFDKILSINYVGIEDCYDISMGVDENSSSFIANGFIVHNCPHSLKTYREDAWRHFYVFDVMEHIEDGSERYLSYSEYKPIMDKYGIDYITPLCSLNNASYDDFVKNLDKNVFLIEDGKGCGEGIVIKNYDYKNKFGNIIWAKIVTSEFREKHARTFNNTDKPQECKQMTEIEIVEKYVTSALCEKVKAR